MIWQNKYSKYFDDIYFNVRLEHLIRRDGDVCRYNKAIVGTTYIFDTTTIAAITDIIT